MNQHHVLGFPDFKKLGNVVQMKMPPDSGPSSMIRIEERAFRDDDFRFPKFVPFEKVAAVGVSGVGDQGDFGVEGEVLSLVPQTTKFALGEIPVLISKFAAVLHHRETETGARVVGFDRSEDHALSNREIFIRSDGVDRVGCLLPFYIDPGGQHSTKRFHDVGMAYHPATLQLLEMPLAEPIWQSADVIHVGMAQGDQRRGEAGSRALAHVEGQIEFRNGDRGLLARDADSMNAIRGQIKKTGLPITGRLLRKHDETPADEAKPRQRTRSRMVTNPRPGLDHVDDSDHAEDEGPERIHVPVRLWRSKAGRPPGR